MWNFSQGKNGNEVLPVHVKQLLFLERLLKYQIATFREIKQKNKFMQQVNCHKKAQNKWQRNQQSSKTCLLTPVWEVRMRRLSNPVVLFKIFSTSVVLLGIETFSHVLQCLCIDICLRTRRTNYAIHPKCITKHTRLFLFFWEHFTTVVMRGDRSSGSS